MPSDSAGSDVFDEPSLWRVEASRALGISGDELIAAISPGPAFPAALRSLTSTLSADAQMIVDLGAGAGGASEWVRQATNASVYAIEPADGARRAAARAFPHLMIIAGRADRVPLRDDIADAVMISGVVSLVADVGSVVAEVERITRRGGQIAIADLFSGGTHSWSAGPNIFRTVEDVVRTMERHGFHDASIGLGDPDPDPAWAEAAESVDKWIDSHCRDRRSYVEWKHDQDHLRRQMESGDLIGGCVVATLSAPSR